MEFRILGPLEVVEEGRPVSLERRRMRALLAFLLLHANEPVSSDRLIDEVWGPEPAKTAAASLQNYISRLRKAIGADAVVSQPPGYLLRVDPAHFDLAQFERLRDEARGAEPRERAHKLRAALALWRGPALDDLAFEPFARDQVGRLEEARLAALEDCIDAELELGHDAELVGELEVLVEEHPLRERFRAQLMRALYRAGRQADALAAFQEARQVLTEELGLEPGEQLRTLQQAILRQDASLGPAAPEQVERADDRRTVTVLFCDLVGSTDLAARLDPEAYRALLSRYFDLVRDPIERHGGTLEKFIGDAVLALFGVPDLHEDDALRAVRAAMEARAALREAEIAARIGVGTGEVHVLSAPGEPLHVSGPPASVAAQLEALAPAGEVLLSDRTYALARDALTVHPHGDAWLVTAVVPGAPAFARRLDAPLVGRADQVERLRAAYDDVCREDHCRVVTVLGEAGIGKTRLLREVLAPLRADATILVGRCASYGQGATYLPIAEAVRQAARDASLEGIAELLVGEEDAEEVAQRVGELAGLAERPAAAGQVFWAVRRFLEAVARDRPVVLVLDDIHWAEPTLLDLVEYLGEWTEAAVLVVCAARRELLESRPTWAGPTSTGFLVELAPLTPTEMTALVLGLRDTPLDADIERRIVEQAGGNPLFAEQLLALAVEAPELALDRMPATVEALLASRLDRLDPGGLAVLRRASVIGRRFTLVQLSDLTPAEEAERIDQHLRALTERGLVHPRRHEFAFHHVLVRDVAYRGIPKAARAELHELAARGLDRRDEADEVVGYHLEQAYRSMTEIGRADERELAAAGAERLGRAGVRAWKRADVPAAINLLTRAVDLSREPNELACELGVALFVGGETARALSVFASAARSSDDRVAARARFELANARSMAEPNRAEDLFAAVESEIPILEAAGDDRALGRAWLAVAHVRGDFFCEYGAMEEASARAVTHYSRSGWSASTALNSLGVALFFGPKPVGDAIAQLEELMNGFEGDRASEANILMWLGGLQAMLGSGLEARNRIELAKQRYRELGLTSAANGDCERMLGFVAMLAGDPAAAAEHFANSCAVLEELGQTQVLATRAGELASSLFAAERYDEAEEWASRAGAAAGDDDVDAALAWKPAAARLEARRGGVADAERRLRELLSATPPDAVVGRAGTLLALGEILRVGGRDDEAAVAVSAAIDLYDAKGNVAAAGMARRLAAETHER